MSEDQAAFYRRIAAAQYQPVYLSMVETYGKDAAWDVAAEVAYFWLNGELPEWGRYIERVEIVNGTEVFVHQNREVLQ